MEGELLGRIMVEGPYCVAYDLASECRGTLSATAPRAPGALEPEQRLANKSWRRPTKLVALGEGRSGWNVYSGRAVTAPTTIGERIYLARTARGLTQAELARAAGLGAVSGVASVSRYERGAERTRGSGAAIAPTAAVLARLAAALRVSIEWLLTGTGRGPRAKKAP